MNLSVHCAVCLKGTVNVQVGRGREFNVVLGGTLLPQKSGRNPFLSLVIKITCSQGNCKGK